MKTTEKDFKYFTERCLYWADRFGLDEWDLYLSHLDLGSQRLAQTSINNPGCVANVALNKDWGYDVQVNKTQLDTTAKHEILHIVIDNLSCLVCSEYVSEDEHVKANESLVVKLCKLIK